MENKATLLLGDCLEQLKSLSDNSVDSIVTDPPYGLSFMGKKWDYEVPSVEIWRECLRVLKPGGHLLSFAGTRTYHRMAVNIEDAGFEIRDQIMWLYGSGFPKSHDVSKAIDKAAGVEFKAEPASGVGFMNADTEDGYNITKNKLSRVGEQTDEAKQWQGWGTALKPANEPIVVARKPLEAKLTVAQNVLKYGTGALNIDASRVATTDKLQKLQGSFSFSGSGGANETGKKIQFVDAGQGRWPANVLLDEEAAMALDESTGLKDAVSRFFYVAKASKRERGEGNVHPTVKPIKLMEYLIKLVTPKDGIVLDPFMGSGTTGVAAMNLEAKFIGCEREQEYMNIAKARIESK